MLITYNKFNNLLVLFYWFIKFQRKKSFLNHFIRINNWVIFYIQDSLNNVSQVWAWSDLTIDDSIMLFQKSTKITLYVIHRSIVKSVAITP